MKATKTEVRLIIRDERCIGCGICVDACPKRVIEISGSVAQVVNPKACIHCRACIELCPQDAITTVRKGDRPS